MENIKKITAGFLLTYTLFIFPALQSFTYAQEATIMPTQMAPTSVPGLTDKNENVASDEAKQLSEKQIDVTSTPSPVESIQESEKEGLIDKISNIILKKIHKGNYAKTRFGSLTKKSFAINDPITLDSISVDPKNDLKIFVMDASKNKTDLEATQIEEDGENALVIRPPRNLKPGKYTLTISDESGETFTDEFYWGVLTLNTNKATYKPNEKATIAIAVLDEKGEMVCDAKVKLQISRPDNSSVTLSTKDKTIKVNKECYQKEFTLTPDYESTFETTVEGEYELKLSAETKNGKFEVEDAFSVSKTLEFDVERNSATRLYPALTYPMYISVTAERDFEGQIIDVVPEEFEIQQAGKGVGYDLIEKAPEQINESDKQVLGASVGELIQPYDGYHKISLHFGELYGYKDLVDKLLNKSKLDGHDGVDIDMPKGTPIRATDEGEVRSADAGTYGKMVIIEHKWGKSYYGHLDKILVNEGDRVSSGDQIGESGDTGVTTGPHLHFGLKRNDADVNNGYNGMVNPEDYVVFETSQSVLGATTGVATNQPTKHVIWNVKLKKGEKIELTYVYNAPPTSPELYKLGKLMFVEKQIKEKENVNVNVNNGFEKLRGTDEFKKTLKEAQEKAEDKAVVDNTKDEKIVFIESRFWQLAVDSVVVSSGIVESEVQFGGLQRKVAYVNSNWYSFYNDGTDVFWKKSSDGITWGSAQNLDVNEDNDADNYNPSIDVSGNYIHIFYMDESADQVQGLRLDTTTDLTTQTSVCGLTSPGAFTVSTYMTSVASLSASAAVVAYSDTSSDTRVDVFEVTGLDAATCTVTDVHPGNMPFGTQGAGLTAGDRAVVAALSSTTALMVYQDGSNLRSAKYNATLDEWTENHNLIANVSDTVYSLAASTTAVWLLTVSGTTGTNFYRYPKSSVGLNETSSAIDSDVGGSGDEQDNYVDITCPSATNCKIVYVDLQDDAAPDLMFVDCDNADCSSTGAGTPRSLDADVGSASENGANPKIFCLSSGANCKIVWGRNLDTTTPDLAVGDCNDDDCDTFSTTLAKNADFGEGTNPRFQGDIYCLSDTDCQILHLDNDATSGSWWLYDCNTANCSAHDNTNAVITGVSGGSNYNVQGSIFCVASGDCRIAIHDGTNSDFSYLDCASAACTGVTPKDIDGTVGAATTSVPNAIDCTPGSGDCKLIYADANDTALFFVDCDAAACNTPVITTIDDTAGATTTYQEVSLDCTLGATDCKGTWAGVTTGGSEQLYFFDCDAADCSSGSAVTLSSGSETMGAVACPATDDCKLAYFKNDTPTLRFADCTNENCMNEWESQTSPWSSQTNVTSVSLTYDSTNSDLYAHIIKDTSEQAYYKSTDATTISWGSETSYAFTAGDLGHISSPEQGAGPVQIGVSLRQGANVEFASSATLISISGTCDQFDQTTDCTDAGAETIAVAVDGTLQAQTDGTVDGAWQIDNVVQPSSGAVITVFVNGEATADQRANAVTKYDGTGNITGIKLYQRHLTIGSDDAQTITNANISSYDYSVSGSDADIFFDVDSNDDLTLDPATTPLYTDETLYTLASNTYQPGAAGSSNVITHHMVIPTSATLTANANTIDVKGSWTNNGTYTCSANTVNLRSVEITDTIKSSGNAFCNLRINNYLMAYHKLDEGTGVTANDASGEGLTGTVSSTPTWTTASDSTDYGENPGAVTLASSRYIGMGNVSPVDFNYTDKISTSTWIKTTSDSGMTVVSKQLQAGGSYRGWMVQTGSGGFIFWQMINTVSTNHMEARTTNDMNYEVGGWHHVVTTYDGSGSTSGVKIYFDGVSQSITSTNNTLNAVTTNSAPFSIGSRNNAEQFWAGDLDDVRVYKRVLTQAEVTDLYAGTHPDEGTYTLIDALDVNGNLTISTGSLDQTSSNFAVNVSGNYLNTANLTTRASSTITLDAGSGTNTIQSDATFNNLTMNDAGGSATFQVARQRFLSAGNVTITGGTFTPASTCNASGVCGITIGGNFTNSDTFTASTGTVTFNNVSNTSALSYSANTTFNNLNVSTAGKAMVFDKDFRTIVSGTLTLAGSACTGRVTLDSEVSGTQFELNATGTKSVSYVDVQDSNAITAITATTSKDSGNNTSWTIDDTPTQAQLMRHGEWFDGCEASRNFTY